MTYKPKLTWTEYASIVSSAANFWADFSLRGFQDHLATQWTILSFIFLLESLWKARTDFDWRLQVWRPSAASTKARAWCAEWASGCGLRCSLACT